MQTTIRTPEGAHSSTTPKVFLPKQILRRAVLLGAVLFGPFCYLLLLLNPTLDTLYFRNTLSHMLLSADTSLLGSALAVLVLRTAYRAGDGRAFLIGMGFLSTASMLIIHYREAPQGISIVGNGLVSTWAPLISLALGGIFFGLSGLNISERINKRVMLNAGGLLILYIVVWLFYTWAFLVVLPTWAIEPGSMAARLNEAARLAIALLGIGSYIFAVRRHYRLYRQSPSPTGLAITCGILLFGEALLTQLTAKLYAPSFWLYQIEIAMGFSLISYAVLRAYHRGQTDEGLLERVFLAGTRARIHSEYAHAMDTLLTMLARAEQPTSEFREQLQSRFSLVESQIDVLEETTAALVQERRQRHELERLNKVLRDVEQEKTQFMHMLVHDLKNPLGAQTGFLEILQHEHLSEYQHMLLDSALRSSRHLAGLIGDLLDLARMEQGRIDVQPTLLSPVDLLRHAVEEMRGWLEQERHNVTYQYDDEVPLLYADMRLMQRVLLNLLSNVIKHTPPGTSIVLRVRRASAQEREITPCEPVKLDPQSRIVPSDYVTLEVADTGMGIPPDRLERVFEKFNCGAGMATLRKDSTGLGLTFCRMAIHAQGGMIDVESVVGKGTTFRMVLPAV